VYIQSSFNYNYWWNCLIPIYSYSHFKNIDFNYIFRNNLLIDLYWFFYLKAILHSFIWLIIYLYLINIRNNLFSTKKFYLRLQNLIHHKNTYLIVNFDHKFKQFHFQIYFNNLIVYIFKIIKLIGYIMVPKWDC